MNSRDGLILIGKTLPPTKEVSQDPDWVQAQTGWINGALRHALELPSGGWYVVGASSEVGKEPRRYRIDGRDYVAWRVHRTSAVAPDSCPHMGASLAEGHCRDGRVVCPWHGLALGLEPHGAWRPLPTYDDGVLVWVRLGSEEEATEHPILPERPPEFFGVVMRREGACDPDDVIANRLDPWHGVHYHPHSFGRLKVIDQRMDTITVRVVYKIFGNVGMEVDARFHCSEPRTICMTIVAGEGVGSVVETHATPIEPGRTAIIEATLATSERPQFLVVMRMLGRIIRPLILKRADRLWIEDAAYAERRYSIRTRGA